MADSAKTCGARRAAALRSRRGERKMTLSRRAPDTLGGLDVARLPIAERGR